jgi:hypothetical protein
MEINSYDKSGMFELNVQNKHGNTETAFIAINPYFFNFLKCTSAGEEHAEPLPGVAIDWAHGRKQPVVTIDDMGINESGQLFYQMYGDQMVAL